MTVDNTVHKHSLVSVSPNGKVHVPTGFKYRIYSVQMEMDSLCFDSRLNHSVEINDT